MKSYWLLGNTEIPIVLPNFSDPSQVDISVINKEIGEQADTDSERESVTEIDDENENRDSHMSVLQILLGNSPMTASKSAQQSQPKSFQQPLQESSEKSTLESASQSPRRSVLRMMRDNSTAKTVEIFQKSVRKSLQMNIPDSLESSIQDGPRESFAQGARKGVPKRASKNTQSARRNTPKKASEIAPKNVHQINADKTRGIVGRARSGASKSKADKRNSSVSNSTDDRNRSVSNRSPERNRLSENINQSKRCSSNLITSTTNSNTRVEKRAAKSTTSLERYRTSTKTHSNDDERKVHSSKLKSFSGQRLVSGQTTKSATMGAKLAKKEKLPRHHLVKSETTTLIVNQQTVKGGKRQDSSLVDAKFIYNVNQSKQNSNVVTVLGNKRKRKSSGRLTSPESKDSRRTSRRVSRSHSPVSPSRSMERSNFGTDSQQCEGLRSNGISKQSSAKRGILRSELLNHDSHTSQSRMNAHSEVGLNSSKRPRSADTLWNQDSRDTPLRSPSMMTVTFDCVKQQMKRRNSNNGFQTNIRSKSNVLALGSCARRVQKSSPIAISVSKSRRIRSKRVLSNTNVRSNSTTRSRTQSNSSASTRRVQPPPVVENSIFSFLWNLFRQDSTATASGRSMPVQARMMSNSSKQSAKPKPSNFSFDFDFITNLFNFDESQDSKRSSKQETSRPRRASSISVAGRIKPGSRPSGSSKTCIASCDSTKSGTRSCGNTKSGGARQKSRLIPRECYESRLHQPEREMTRYTNNRTQREPGRNISTSASNPLVTRPSRNTKQSGKLYGGKKSYASTNINSTKVTSPKIGVKKRGQTNSDDRLKIPPPTGDNSNTVKSPNRCRIQRDHSNSDATLRSRHVKLENTMSHANRPKSSTVFKSNTGLKHCTAQRRNIKMSPGGGSILLQQKREEKKSEFSFLDLFALDGFSCDRSKHLDNNNSKSTSSLKSSLSHRNTTKTDNSPERRKVRHNSPKTDDSPECRPPKRNSSKLNDSSEYHQPKRNSSKSDGKPERHPPKSNTSKSDDSLEFRTPKRNSSKPDDSRERSPSNRYSSQSFDFPKGNSESPKLDDSRKCCPFNDDASKPDECSDFEISSSKVEATVGCLTENLSPFDHNASTEIHFVESRANEQMSAESKEQKNVEPWRRFFTVSDIDVQGDSLEVSSPTSTECVQLSTKPLRSDNIEPWRRLFTKTDIDVKGPPLHVIFPASTTPALSPYKKQTITMPEAPYRRRRSEDNANSPGTFFTHHLSTTSSSTRHQPSTSTRAEVVINMPLDDVSDNVSTYRKESVSESVV